MAKIKSQVWTNYDQHLYLEEPANQTPLLENAIYKLGIDQNHTLYLRKTQESFNFDYKLYGLESDLIERVLRTYAKTPSGNIGVLLNGLKGTGKTVTSKVIANRLNQPVIVVEGEFKGCHRFLNSIPQNVTIFIDEYEKIFGKSSEMLTIMDGALNSLNRRVFLLTTNNLSVDENLIQRPGRIRYLKKFDDLAPHIVAEIVDDLLEHKKLRSQCIEFISSLEIITVDIIKAILLEVNIHEEAPEVFQSVFNVKKIRGKFNIKLKNDDGVFETLVEECSMSPRPMFKENHVGDWVSFNNTYIGRVTNVIDWKTIEVSPVKGNNSTANWLTKPMIFKVQDADTIHENYKYDEFGGFTQLPAKPTIFSKLSKTVNDYINDLGLDESEDEIFEKGSEVQVVSEQPMPSVDLKLLSKYSVGQVIDLSDVLSEKSSNESHKYSAEMVERDTQPQGESQG